jgi:peptidoglycan hydrolase-like protein with peptidoglycan-binding domain
MSQGANSEAVRILQNTLNYCYSENLTPDSDFGPLTKTALIRAQKAAGAARDGHYGPETRSKIEHRGTGPIFGCVHVP